MQWLQNMSSAVLFLRVQGGVACLLWVQPLTDCSSSPSTMSRVIILNSSYIFLTVFCHLVRQSSCQAASPHGYFSDPFQHFWCENAQDLKLRECAYSFVIFLIPFTMRFFLFQIEACRTDFSDLFFSLGLAWQKLEACVKLHFICDK